MRAMKTTALSILAFLLGIAVAQMMSRGGKNLHAGAAALPEIILYTEPDFQGRELHLYADAPDLPFEDLVDGSRLLWNDNVGSIVVVSGTWRVYQHGRMNTLLDDTPIAALDLNAKESTRGWSSVLSATSRGPLMIASPELAGIDSDISSVQLVSAENLPDWMYGN